MDDSKKKPLQRHLTVKLDGAAAPMTACLKAVGWREAVKTTSDPEEAACYRCAKEGYGLSEHQRQVIWDNRNEQLGSFRRSPWQVASEKLAKAEKRAAERAAKERQRELAKEKKAARVIHNPAATPDDCEPCTVVVRPA